MLQLKLRAKRLKKPFKNRFASLSNVKMVISDRKKQWGHSIANDDCDIVTWNISMKTIAKIFLIFHQCL